MGKGRGEKILSIRVLLVGKVVIWKYLLEFLNEIMGIDFSFTFYFKTRESNFSYFLTINYYHIFNQFSNP